MTKRKKECDKLKVGRHPFYKTPEEMQVKIKEFFDNPPTFTRYFDGVPIEVPCLTITGLVLHLGFCDRHSFRDYENNKPEFTSTMKKARAFIENHYEKLLQQGSPTGAIFALKNFGWRDDKGIELSGDVKTDNTVTVTFIKADEEDETTE